MEAEQKTEEPAKVVGYINERMLSILRSGMTPCTTISPVKTEYAQVAIYIEDSK